MVTNSFATFVAMSGRSYSKPIVKAIASFFLDSSFCSDGLMSVRLRMKSTISVPETRSSQPEVRLVFFRNGKQIVAGHYPLFDDLNTIVGERRDCRADKVARNFLRLNKDGALRDVSRGPDDGNQGADRKDRPERGQQNKARAASTRHRGSAASGSGPVRLLRTVVECLPLQHAHSKRTADRNREHTPPAHTTATPSPRRCAAPKPAQKPRKKLLQQKFDPGKRLPASKPWSMPRSMKFRWPVAPRPRFCAPGRNPFPT